MSQRLAGVRQAPRESRLERFTALLHHLSVGLLRDSFYSLKRQALPGVDGVTWQEYEAGLEGRLDPRYGDIYGHLIPSANVNAVDRLDAQTTPQESESQAQP